MITNLVLWLIQSAAAVVFALLPTHTLGIFVGVEDTAMTIASYMGPVDTVLPAYETMVAVGVVILIWLPAVVAYSLANWIYRHVPVLGGGG